MLPEPANGGINQEDTSQLEWLGLIINIWEIVGRERSNFYSISKAESDSCRFNFVVLSVLILRGQNSVRGTVQLSLSNYLSRPLC